MNVPECDFAGVKKYLTEIDHPNKYPTSSTWHPSHNMFSYFIRKDMNDELREVLLTDKKHKPIKFITYDEWNKKYHPDTFGHMEKECDCFGELCETINCPKCLRPFQILNTWHSWIGHKNNDTTKTYCPYCKEEVKKVMRL